MLDFYGVYNAKNNTENTKFLDVKHITKFESRIFAIF